MTCYLTDDTDPDDVERGFRDGLFTGVKLYPANATTNSAAGVTDYKKVMPVLERMEKIDMPFLMHGEDTDPDVDIFDREKAFIDRYLTKWVKQFPGLALHPRASVVERRRRLREERGAPSRRHHHALSHDADPQRLVRSRAKALHVRDAGDQNRARPHGAAQGRDLGRGVLFPRPRFRAASLFAHSTNGVPGMFNAPVAIETYARVFEEEGALDKLEAFASLNGPKYYRMPPNEDKITLEKTSWTTREEVEFRPRRARPGLSRRRDDRVEGGRVISPSPPPGSRLRAPECKLVGGGQGGGSRGDVRASTLVRDLSTPTPPPPHKGDYVLD